MNVKWWRTDEKIFFQVVCLFGEDWKATHSKKYEIKQNNANDDEEHKERKRVCGISSAIERQRKLMAKQIELYPCEFLLRRRSEILSFFLSFFNECDGFFWLLLGLFAYVWSWTKNPNRCTHTATIFFWMISLLFN